MSHRNAPLSPEGRRRLVQRCQDRQIAHVAAEMGISRSCASKWVNRHRQYGELGLQDRSSTPHRLPTAMPAEVIDTIEHLRRTRKWSATHAGTNRRPLDARIPSSRPPPGYAPRQLQRRRPLRRRTSRDEVLSQRGPRRTTHGALAAHAQRRQPSVGVGYHRAKHSRADLPGQRPVPRRLAPCTERPLSREVPRRPISCGHPGGVRFVELWHDDKSAALSSVVFAWGTMYLTLTGKAA